MYAIETHGHDNHELNFKFIGEISAQEMSDHLAPKWGIIGTDSYGTTIQKIVDDPAEYFAELEFVKNFKIPEYDAGSRTIIDRWRKPLPTKKEVCDQLPKLRFHWIDTTNVCYCPNFKFVGFIQIFVEK